MLVRIFLTVVLFSWGLYCSADKISSVGDEAENGAPEATHSSSVYFSLGRVNIDSQVISDRSLGIKDAATSWRLGWEGRAHSLLYGVGVSGFLYSDNAAFRQTVEDNFGNTRSAKSSATAVSLYFEGGFRYDWTSSIDLDLLAGAELVLESERSIGYCTNCYEESIDVDSGLYIQPRVNFNFENQWYFAISQITYLSGDIENGFSLTVGKHW